jgi:histidyl-tRNA synthetase
MIDARIVKGFRDFLPADEELRLELIGKLQKLFIKRGFRAVDTPVLEYAETLLGKSGGETEKQIFRFTDNGGRDVALRFDLTVPFARYMAMHREELGLPFKRFHIAKAWRGENPQKGRYREFIQCDFDIVGSDSLQSDIDILLTAFCALKNLGVKGITIHINHRGILNAFLERHNLTDKTTYVLRAIDKLPKVGADAVTRELEAFMDKAAAGQLLLFIKREITPAETLKKLETLAGHSAAFQRLKELYAAMQQLDLADYFTIDPAICRGLDYYTGMVFETFFNDLPSIGSICSGGRYDNLMALYSREKLSGVGGSVGLDRLIAALYETAVEVLSPPSRKVLLAYGSETIRLNAMALFLQEKGFSCDIFPLDKKYEAQVKYGLRHGCTWFIEAKPDGGWFMRNLVNRSTLQKESQAAVLEEVEKYGRSQE